MLHSFKLQAAIRLPFLAALAIAELLDETAFLQTQPAVAHSRGGVNNSAVADSRGGVNNSAFPGAWVYREAGECNTVCDGILQIWENLSLGIAYVHIPKNAGTTIEAAVGFESVRHCTAKMFQDCKVQERNLKLFTSLRNPYDRAVSAFLMWAQMGFMNEVTSELEGFRTFLTELQKTPQEAGMYKDRDFADSSTPQVYSVYGVDEELLVHEYLRVKWLEEDWTLLQQAYPGLPNLPEPQNVADPHPPYCFYYEGNRDLANIVASYYAADFLFMNLSSDLSDSCKDYHQTEHEEGQ